MPLAESLALSSTTPLLFIEFASTYKLEQYLLVTAIKGKHDPPLQRCELSFLYATNGLSLNFVKPDGTYGGQMMPKTTGWQGMIPSLNGGSITEYSLGGNTPKEPFYPMVTQGMTPQMIKNTQLLEAGLLSQTSPEARALKENAYKQYLKLNKQGKSAFKDYN